MSDEKQNQGSKFGLREESKADDSQKNPMASRARNRTVMLSPQVTDRVRELLSHESGGANPVNPGSTTPDPVNQILQPQDLGPRSKTTPGTGSQEADLSADQLTGKPYRSKRVSDVLGQTVNANLAQSATPAPAIPLGIGLSASGAAISSPTTIINSGLVTRNKKTKLIGFLVSFEKEEEGEVVELRTGRWLLTSQPTEHGDYILIDDPSVSPLHAIVRVTKEGKVQVLDQLSENGTSITRANSSVAEDVSGTMVDVQHGDKIHFGKRSFFVCLLPAEV